MGQWTAEELRSVGGAEELTIQSLRQDGSLRNPVTIWVVARNDDVYVRAIGGRTSPWFRGTRTRGQGRIEAGGVVKDVDFADAQDEAADELDALYREKYGRYPERVLGTVLTPGARAATLKLVPRS